jgi:phage terminase large subunit
VLLRVRHPGRVLLDGTRRRRARWPDPKRPWDPTLGVTTAWDLGISDAMAIVFAQTTGIEVRIIDYLENTGQGLAYYAKRLGEKSYRYTEHILPHDADQREVGPGKTRLETLRAMSFRALRVLPNLPITDGIEQARQLLARAYFDRDRCRPLLKSLEHYRTDWLESRRTFALRPRTTGSAPARMRFAIWRSVFGRRPCGPARA